MKLATLLLAAGALAAQPPGVKFEVLQVRPNIYLFASSIGNVTVQIGEQANNDGVLVVDTGDGRLTERIQSEIRKLTAKPVRYVLNTSADAARTGGNEAIAKSGKPLASFSSGSLGTDIAMVTAHERVLERMSERNARGQTPMPSGAWPGLTFSTGRDFYFNGEPIQLLHTPGHTDGDALVFFRNSNVIVAGDNYTTLGYPRIDLARGGSINGVVAALNKILELAIPADNEEGGTLVIPAEGRLSDEGDLSDYRDMITIIHDRVADGVKKGKTLAQVQSAKPTLDYDGRYSRPGWTGAQFTEAIYNSLKREAK